MNQRLADAPARFNPAGAWRNCHTGGFAGGANLSFRRAMPPSLIIIDDFLSDPHGFRRKALALDYDPKRKNGNCPGLISFDTSRLGSTAFR